MQIEIGKLSEGDVFYNDSLCFSNNSGIVEKIFENRVLWRDWDGLSTCSADTKVWVKDLDEILSPIVKKLALELANCKYKNEGIRLFNMIYREIKLSGQDSSPIPISVHGKIETK